MEPPSSAVSPEAPHSVSAPSWKSFRTLFSEAWTGYRAHWKNIVVLLGVPYLVSFALVLAVASIVPGLSDKAIESISSGIGGIIMGLANIFLLFYVAAPTQTPMQTVRRVGSRKVVDFVLLGLLESVILLGAFLCLILPGIYLSILFSFSQYVLVDEGKRGWEALQTSARYIKGDAWHAIGYLIGFGLSVGLVTLVLFIPLSALIGKNTLTIVANIVQTIFVGPIGVYFGFGLYRNMKEVKLSRHAGEAFEKKRVTQIVALGYLIGALALAFGGWTFVRGNAEWVKQIWQPNSVEVNTDYTPEGSSVN